MQYYEQNRRVRQISYSLQKQNRAILFLNSCILSHDMPNFLCLSSPTGKIEIITHYITHTIMSKAYTCQYFFLLFISLLLKDHTTGPDLQKDIQVPQMPMNNFKSLRRVLPIARYYCNDAFSVLQLGTQTVVRKQRYKTFYLNFVPLWSITQLYLTCTQHQIQDVPFSLIFFSARTASSAAVTNLGNLFHGVACKTQH